MKRNGASSEEVALKVSRSLEPIEATINKLPRGVLMDIFLNLPPSDRIRSTLTCRYWAEIVTSELLLEDVRLTIRGEDMRIAAPILMNTKRRYRNLRIFRANLNGYRSELWGKVGKYLRELELDGCRLGAVELHSILTSCPGLEVLKIRAYSPRGNISPVMLHALGSFDHDEIRESTQKVRYVLLNFVITEMELQHMISLLPNITSLILSSGTKTDYCLPGTNSPLQDLPYSTLTTNHMLTKLDFLDVRLLDAQVELLIGTYSDILQEVRLNTFHLTSSAYEAVARCTKLEHLYLPLADELQESHLMALAWNSRNLLTLDLSYCDLLTETCIPYILSFKGLRHVSLLGCKNISRNGLRDLTTISNLEYLNLQDTKFHKDDVLNLAQLKNLRALISDVEINSKAFAMICEKFPKLKKLKLLACEGLTDEDAVRLRAMKNLDDLHMRIGVGFTDSTFENPLGAAAMEGLFLDGCPMTDVGLAGIAANHGRLKHLVLSDCLRVTDHGLAHFVLNEPFLEKLELYYCDSVRGTFLTILAQTCPRLERVIFAECPVSNRAVRTFRNQRPHVMLDCDD